MKRDFLSICISCFVTNVNSAANHCQFVTRCMRNLSFLKSEGNVAFADTIQPAIPVHAFSSNTHTHTHTHRTKPCKMNRGGLILFIRLIFLHYTLILRVECMKRDEDESAPSDRMNVDNSLARGRNELCLLRFHDSRAIASIYLSSCCVRC